MSDPVYAGAHDGPPVEIRRPEDVTADWLTGVLQENDLLGPDESVAAVQTTPIGTGQMSENHRIAITYADGKGAGPASVVLKVSASDERSRQTGADFGAYAREVRFYDEYAPSIDGPLAPCLHARIEPSTGWFTLLLEDLDPARQGDQIAGCSVTAAERAIDGLAAIHAARWDEDVLVDTEWLSAPTLLNQALIAALLPGFEERYAGQIDAAHLDVCRRFAGAMDGWAADPSRPHTFVHGDYRLDNMLFAERTDAPPTVVDWQTVAYGPALVDVSYFLGGSLQTEDRQAEEERLVRRYHQRLAGLGVTGFAWEDCWHEYRRLSFTGILMAIAGSMLSARTERGDEMFMVTLARHAHQVLDLDALALLPDPAPPTPLAVKADDEWRHEPDDEPLWNESWYADFTTDEVGIAGYTRLGLYPNQDEAWLTIALVQAGRPSVMAMDFHVPVPDRDAEGLAAASTTSELRATHACDVPLERFTVRASGVGRRFEDPAAILAGATGSEVPFSMELTWTTVGTPYQYRLTTRYEIPCGVQGTVTVGDESFAVDGRGQRDHSWGTRDWWSMDWCWMAGHLDDGTMFHGTDLRLPGQPRLGMGYVQGAGGTPVDELGQVLVAEQIDPDGLAGSAQATLGPPELQLDMSAIAHGPLVLTSSDGRVAHFPRAAYRVRTTDGRTGLAWAEFNLNQ